MLDFDGHCSCCLAGSRLRADPRDSTYAFSVYRTWWVTASACETPVLNATNPSMCDADSVTGQGCIFIGAPPRAVHNDSLSGVHNDSWPLLALIAINLVGAAALRGVRRRQTII